MGRGKALMDRLFKTMASWCRLCEKSEDAVGRTGGLGHLGIDISLEWWVPRGTSRMMASIDAVERKTVALGIAGCKADRERMDTLVTKPCSCTDCVHTSVCES